MINARMKRTLLSATIAIGAAVAVAGPVTGQPPQADALYHYYYFDQSYTETAGEAEDECHYSGISRATNVIWGTQTAYHYEDIWAYCRDGQLTLN